MIDVQNTYVSVHCYDAATAETMRMLPAVWDKFCSVFLSIDNSRALIHLFTGACIKQGHSISDHFILMFLDVTFSLFWGRERIFS